MLDKQSDVLAINAPGWSAGHFQQSDMTEIPEPAAIVADVLFSCSGRPMRGGPSAIQNIACRKSDSQSIFVRRRPVLIEQAPPPGSGSRHQINPLANEDPEGYLSASGRRGGRRRGPRCQDMLQTSCRAVCVQASAV